MLESVDRAIELLYLTIEDEKNKIHLKELFQLKKLLIDYFHFDNSYNSLGRFLKKIFFSIFLYSV
jgi:hypothetical protein